MSIKNLFIVSNGYPTKSDPQYAFIKPVVDTLSDLEIECTLLVPQSIKKQQKRPLYWEDSSPTGKRISVYQPTYLSFSNFSFFGLHLSSFFKEKALKKAFQIACKNRKPDMFYGHFWDSAILACSLDKRVPVTVATGESTIHVFTEDYSKHTVDKRLSQIKKVICVSSKNLRESRELGLLRYDPDTIVLPNAIDTSEFYHIPRDQARQALHWNNEDFIISFVGAFIHRKGVNRLIQACKRIPNAKIVLIGKGDPVEPLPQIIFSGRLPHDQIVTYLNATDIFVLPTLAEGCCNAIVEAMACGLPIVSSNLPFNDDILDETNSIRIDPNSIDEIERAIRTLMNDATLRRKMEEESLKKAERLTINRRGQEIYSFISK